MNIKISYLQLHHLTDQRNQEVQINQQKMKFPFINKQKVASSTQTSFKSTKSYKIKKPYRCVIQLISSQDQQGKYDNLNLGVQFQRDKLNKSQINTTEDSSKLIELQDIVFQNQIIKTKNNQPQRKSKKTKNQKINYFPKTMSKQRRPQRFIDSYQSSFEFQIQNSQDKELIIQNEIQSSEQHSNYSIASNNILFRQQFTSSNNHTQNKRQNQRSSFINRGTQASSQESQRIKRSKNQKMYLLGVQRDIYKCWTLAVLGNQKIRYNIQIAGNSTGGGNSYTSSHMTTCTCIDFGRNYKPCKHIYFVFTQVAKADFLINNLANNIELKDKDFTKLDRLLLNRLGQRIEQEQAIQIQDKQNQKNYHNQVQECSICFIDMIYGKDKLQKCQRCNKFMHKQCLKNWKAHKNNCPLCRAQFNTPNMSRQPGALQMLQFVQIANQQLAFNNWQYLN